MNQFRHRLVPYKAIFVITVCLFANSQPYARIAVDASPEQLMPQLDLPSPEVGGNRVAEPNQNNDVTQLLANLPLAFESNRGQLDPTVKYLARAPGYKVFLTSQESVMVFGGGPVRRSQAGSDEDSPSSMESIAIADAAVIRMRFEGANPTPSIIAEEPLTFTTNYFIGAEPESHFTDIQNHSRVKLNSIYPGIDLVYYGNQQQLEYDLVVAPNANPKRIKLRLSGAEKMALSRDGDLILTTRVGDISYHKPIAYQNIAGNRVVVRADYVLAKNGDVQFRLGKYDPSHSLIIDPLVTYSSFVWGSADAIAVDAAGNAYIAGATTATDLPASLGYQKTLAGTTDAYIVKIDPTGSKVIFATYLGVRRASTAAKAIAIDGGGNVYLAGNTDSTSFPVTSGAYQSTYLAGAGFITKLNASGNALVYSTYLNGVSTQPYQNGATPVSMAVDSGGNTFITGLGNITTTNGAFQRVNSGTYFPVFVAKLNASGTAMTYATYVSGSQYSKAGAIAVDSSGNAYVVGATDSPDFPVINAFQPVYSGGRNAFVTKVNPSGTALLYSTFLGGNGGGEEATGVAVNSSGQAFVVGNTGSAGFPTTPGVFQPKKGYPVHSLTNGFITKFSAAGTPIYSSFIGGTWCTGCTSATGDIANAVAIDAAGYAYIGGAAYSPAFPSIESVSPIPTTDLNSLQPAPFIAKVSPLGDKLIYSTVIGLRGPSGKKISRVATDATDNVYGVGFSDSFYSFHPTTAGAFRTTGTGFVIKLATGKYSTLVRSLANPAAAGEPVTFIANVQNPTPGGTVTFTDGSTTFPPVAIADGTATLTATLPAGIHKITAVYSLDGKISPPIYQIINSN